jgi:hypothetical protein
MKKITYDDKLEVIKALIANGASIPVVCRRLKLKQTMSMRRWLQETHADLFNHAMDNGKLNQKAPAKGRLL